MLRDRKNQVLILLIFVIAVLTLVRNVLIVSSYFWGLDMYLYEQEEMKIHRENVLLKEELLQVTSLTNIEPQAKQKGFVPATYKFLH